MAKKKTEIKVIDWMRFRKLYAFISISLILSGIIALVSWGLPLGLEFTGGANIRYETTEDFDAEKLENIFTEKEIPINVIQSAGENSIIVKSGFINEEKRQELNSSLNEELNLIELEFQNVGPTISDELIKKTFYATALAAAVILLWVTYQFKKLDYGVAAILAMLHDTFILIGSFTILGHFYDAEVDFLFITAVLTTLSFSVHDTIVVFDRIREIRKIHGGSLYDVSNKAVTETMRRSIVNSLTIIFVLLALVVLGGESIRWFATALLIGAVAGTYSSPFVAVPLLTLLSKIKLKKK